LFKLDNTSSYYLMKYDSIGMHVVFRPSFGELTSISMQLLII
jgi:hypothetical protein